MGNSFSCCNCSKLKALGAILDDVRFVDGAWRCPNGHVLAEAFPEPQRGGTMLAACNICERLVDPNLPFFSCRPCDFDLCFVCRLRLRAPLDVAATLEEHMVAMGTPVLDRGTNTPLRCEDGGVSFTSAVVRLASAASLAHLRTASVPNLRNRRVAPAMPVDDGAGQNRMLAEGFRPERAGTAGRGPRSAARQAVGRRGGSVHFEGSDGGASTSTSHPDSPVTRPRRAMTVGSAELTCSGQLPGMLSPEVPHTNASPLPAAVPGAQHAEGEQPLTGGEDLHTGPHDSQHASEGHADASQAFGDATEGPTYRVIYATSARRHNPAAEFPVAWTAEGIVVGEPLQAASGGQGVMVSPRGQPSLRATSPNQSSSGRGPRSSSGVAIGTTVSPQVLSPRSPRSPQGSGGGAPPPAAAPALHDAVSGRWSSGGLPSIMSTSSPRLPPISHPMSPAPLTPSPLAPSAAGSPASPTHHGPRPTSGRPPSRFSRAQEGAAQPAIVIGRVSYGGSTAASLVWAAGGETPDQPHSGHRQSRLAQGMPAVPAPDTLGVVDNTGRAGPRQAGQALQGGVSAGDLDQQPLAPTLEARHDGGDKSAAADALVSASTAGFAPQTPERP